MREVAWFILFMCIANGHVIYCATASSASCANAKRQCSYWTKNGFCNHTFYSDAHRKSKCAMACGLCGGDASNGNTNNNIYPPGIYPGVCVDAVPNCAMLVAGGYCSLYTLQDGQQKCCATCRAVAIQGTNGSPNPGNIFHPTGPNPFNVLPGYPNSNNILPNYPGQPNPPNVLPQPQPNNGNPLNIFGNIPNPGGILPGIPGISNPNSIFPNLGNIFPGGKK